MFWILYFFSFSPGSIRVKYLLYFDKTFQKPIEKLAATVAKGSLKGRKVDFGSFKVGEYQTCN